MYSIEILILICIDQVQYVLHKKEKINSKIVILLILNKLKLIKINGR